MSNNIAIFLTVLASSCLGMYFYYNEKNIEFEDSEELQDSEHLQESEDLKYGDEEDNNNNNNNNEPSHSEEQEIYFGKKIRNTKSKSKRNKRSTPKKYVSSRKTY